MLGYVGQWDIRECVPTSAGIAPTWGAQLLSPSHPLAVPPALC